MDTKTVDSHAKRQGRVEDDHLLRGHGRFMADAPLPGQAYACFVRSPHACADIKSIDTKAALAAKGVIAVLTAADMKAANVGNLSQHPPLAGRGGGKLVVPVRPALAGDRVRHIGEAVAMVIGETLAAAQDGAELVEVDYATREAAIDLRAAVKPSAPQVWPEAPGNIAVDWAGLAPNPDENARRSTASSPLGQTRRAHFARISASTSPRWSRAAAPRAMTRPATAICCGSARRARASCATRWRA
jgi:carbon-monoxide dehydrogenase large subunit